VTVNASSSGVALLWLGLLACLGCLGCGDAGGPGEDVFGLDAKEMRRAWGEQPVDPELARPRGGAIVHEFIVPPDERVTRLRQLLQPVGSAGALLWPSNGMVIGWVPDDRLPELVETIGRADEHRRGIVLGLNRWHEVIDGATGRRPINLRWHASLTGTRRDRLAPGKFRIIARVLEGAPAAAGLSPGQFAEGGYRLVPQNARRVSTLATRTPEMIMLDGDLFEPLAVGVPLRRDAVLVIAPLDMPDPRLPESEMVDRSPDGATANAAPEREAEHDAAENPTAEPTAPAAADDGEGPVTEPDAPPQLPEPRVDGPTGEAGAPAPTLGRLLFSRRAGRQPRIAIVVLEFGPYRRGASPRAPASPLDALPSP